MSGEGTLCDVRGDHNKQARQRDWGCCPCMHRVNCMRCAWLRSAHIMVQADDQERYQNLGAVAVLHGPSWDEPAFKQFKAVHPRPQCQATYEVSSAAV